MDKPDKTTDLTAGFSVYRLQKKFPAPVPAHFHQYHKIIFLRQGEAEGIIEGKKYSVRPRDVVIIPAGDVHKPLLKADTNYDCTIISVAPEFLARYRRDADDLAQCFNFSGVMHAVTNCLQLSDKLNCIEGEESLVGFADNLYREILFLEFMIFFNHSLRTKSVMPLQQGTYDSRILSLMEFVNAHLGEKLTIDLLAKKFFFSRYYIMHKFKAEVGIGIYKYIMIRRLFLAKKLLLKKYPINRICSKCGFKDSVTLSRAFKVIGVQR